MSDDRELVARAVAGDERAFEVLVERHFNAVYYTAYARLGEPEVAEDLAQEVFLRAFLHLSQLSDGDRFANWVCRVARNLAEDWRRRRQTASRLLPLVPMEKEISEVVETGNENVRERLERREREGAIRKAVMELPPEAREIVLLLYAEGLSEREVGRRLGLHHTTVRYHHQRALELFRTQVGQWLQEDITALRPRSGASRKAAAIVGAAALLSAQSKSALAAASAASFPAAVGASGAGAAPAAAAAAAAAVSASAGSSAPSLAKVLLTCVFTGGGIMKGKLGITIGAFLVLAATGGVYYSAAKPGGWVTPSVKIVPSQKAGHSREYGNPLLGDFGIERISVEGMLAAGASTSPARLILRKDHLRTRYDIRITGVCLDPDESLGPILRKEIPRQTGYTYWTERRTTEVLVLRAPAGRGPGLKDPGSWGDERLVPGRVQADRASMGKLARGLERVIGIPVIDETGLTGEYSFELKWHPRKPEMVPTYIRKQLGLELKREQREIEMVVAGRKEAGR